MREANKKKCWKENYDIEVSELQAFQSAKQNRKIRKRKSTVSTEWNVHARSDGRVSQREGRCAKTATETSTKSRTSTTGSWMA